MIEFVLCDDNESFLKKLASILECIFMKYDINAEISYTSPNPQAIIEFLKTHSLDVLFLDVDLKASISGLDLAKHVRALNKSIYIIFLTGHFEYSMLAYKVKTFDYLVKPISTEKLEETVLRLYEDINGNNAKYIKLGNGRHLLKADEILFIEKERTRAIIHTTSSTLTIYSTLDELKSCLPANFVRCHKSYIVNMSTITRIDEQKNSLYINNSEIPYSRKFKKLERFERIDLK